MKSYILIFLFSSTFTTLSGQCIKYVKAYCLYKQGDTTNYLAYPSKYFYPSKSIKRDTIIPNCSINLDINAFCKGVKTALAAEYIGLKIGGDPNHISSCLYQSYEKHGVRLLPLGDIILWNQDEVDGYNFIMRQRIIDSIGIEKYNSLGQIDTTLQELNYENLKVLKQALKSEIINDTTVLLSIDTTVIAKTVFKHLRGAVFSTINIENKSNNQHEFSYEALQNGVKIFAVGDYRRRIILRIDFKDYQNTDFCRTVLGFASLWTIPIFIYDD